MSNELQVLLKQQLNTLADSAIWLIEENSQSLQLEQFALEQCQAIKVSNRLDLASSYQASFSDFQIKSLLNKNTSKEKHLIFRIAKEKAINLHVIYSALQYIHLGSLTLYGFKNEGIKSLQKLIQEESKPLEGCKVSQKKYSKQLSILHIELSRHTPPSLSFDDYHQHYNLTLDNFRFISKPGQFGWKKTDLGSQLLIEQLSLLLPSINNLTTTSLLDLGCGYGYLSIKAKQLGFNTIDATDNCAAALLSCQENFQLHQIEGQVIASNCADNINKKYDIILCNPPFHHGFDHNVSLTEVFIKSSAKHLKKDGFALFVVNEFVGIEKEANKHFTKQQLLDKKSGFKVLLLKP